jgi:hypothetical protein
VGRRVPAFKTPDRFFSVADRQLTDGETVRSVLVQATLSPGPGHAVGTGTPAELEQAYAHGAQPDTIYVHATLLAVLDSARLVSTERPDMGCSVKRSAGEGNGQREIDWHIRTMLGLGERRPPRLAWDRLIEALELNGITITEERLMALPLTIELDQGLRDALGERRQP